MTVPDTMTVIAIDRPGGPEVLRAETRPVPKPGRGEVLIKIAAAGLNGADLSQRQGRYPVPPGASDLLGLEAAGTIAALGDDLGGEDVAGWKVGDPVCVLLNGGGYAEYCVAPAAHCLPVPRGLSVVEAAALPEVVMTVWLNVFEIGRLAPGEVLLVHGGSSGIGTTAIQLARALGSRVLATAGSAEKCRRCVELGAERAIDYREEDFVAAANDVTRGAGVDVILDMVGGSYLQRNLAALAQKGRLVMIAFKAGIRIEVDFSPIQAKQLTITGSRLRPRPAAEKARLAVAVRKAVWPLLESGTIRPVIDSTVPLREVVRAHERMQASLHVGKILLTT
ncbi:MAG TPA: NAD(P)H-quinone oxidoreductase [Alphaproteobacteria bacterium]|nr:NAD(P)H-quinone oxidoreductase [Alphaproteobacteria bacterium]